MTALSVRSFPSRAALDGALAERLASAIGAHGPSALMLSGGTTPLPAYRSLAARALPHDALPVARQVLAEQLAERRRDPLGDQPGGIAVHHRRRGALHGLCIAFAPRCRRAERCRRRR